MTQIHCLAQGNDRSPEGLVPVSAAPSVRLVGWVHGCLAQMDSAAARVTPTERSRVLGENLVVHGEVRSWPQDLLCVCVSFLGSNLRHMEGPRLGV